MKTKKLIKEMKKFSRQTPSKDFEEKVRHNIKTTFVFDEKPNYNFKEFIMKTWKKLAFAPAIAVLATVAILSYLSFKPMTQHCVSPKYNANRADILKEKRKINGAKVAGKLVAHKKEKSRQIPAFEEKLCLVECKEEYEDFDTFGASPVMRLAKKKDRMLGAKCMDFIAPVCPAPLPQEKFNTEDYDRIYDNEFKDSRNNPLSTFSIDVDSASYANLRRYLNSNSMPPKDAVRIEEMINYFNYDYPQPEKDEPFSISSEVVKCPWNSENNLVMIGLQGKKINIEKLPPNNLVFLLDVSGSMDSPNKLPLLKSAFKLLVKQLRPVDRVSIVVYAGAAGMVLDATPGDRIFMILNAINNLNAGGSTAGGAGIKLAYKIAKENLISEGNNRIIVATDGDFNIGASSDSALVRMIEEKRNQGIFLTVLGFGMGNYKDNKMEKLADKGNGNYAYIDDIMEAKKVLVNELGATLFTIAKDVKLQIEFNPSEVKAYRLIGYENRVLAKEDFNDDKKDAGELGAGHSVTAFYEIVPADSTQTFAKVDDLKYQKTKAKKSKELLTIKLRYKKPNENKSKLLSRMVEENDISKEMSESCAFASAVAEFGMLLRDSKYKGDASYKTILNRARNSKGKDFNGYRAEFVRLVERAEMIALPKEVPLKKTSTEPILRGFVSLAWQTSDISARVWAEDINKKTQEIIPGTSAKTKSDGSFSIALNKLSDKFIVKAETEFYFPASSEIIYKTNLLENRIAINIPTEGGFITGKLMTDTGLIITNATASYAVYNAPGRLKPDDNIPLNIEKDGTYTTPNLPVGKCDIRLSKSNFLDISINCYIKDGETIVKDAIFKGYENNICVVRDSVTKERVREVEIICISSNNISSKSLDNFTDASGEFRVLLGMENLNLEFRHPDYAPSRKSFQSRCYPRTKTVEISKGGDVIIIAVDENNEPITNCKIKLNAPHGWSWKSPTDDFGEYLFKNTPTNLRYVFADLISSDGSNIIARSERFKVEPGVTTTVKISRVSSKLIVRFSEPISKRSIYAQAFVPKEFSIQRGYRHNDFLKTSNDWVLANLKKGVYNVRIFGNDIVEMRTNIFVDGKIDKILEINSDINTNATGIIKGTIHDSSGTPLSAWVHAWEHGSLPKYRFNLHGGHGCVSFAYPKNGDFQLKKLDPQKTYDVNIEIAGLTNYIFKSVIPNKKPIELITPAAYRVTGTIINSAGEPIVSRIWISDELFGDNGTSDFELFPVFPGNYTVKINAPNSPFVRRDVTITSGDVDLGDIIIDDEGITISGRLIDSNGQPIIDKGIYLYGPGEVFYGQKTYSDMHYNKTDDNGIFEVKNLPSDKIIMLNFQLPNIHNFKRDIGPFSIDTDIGDIILSSPPFSIITVLKADGSPAAGLYVDGRKLDENGIYQGTLYYNSDSVKIYKTKEECSSYNGYKAKIPVTDSLTNRVTITLPEGF